jgi:hypothetical protein
MHARIWIVAVIGLAAPVVAQGQLQTPSDWRWRSDGPVKLVALENVPPDGLAFVAMPPGWHITTGPGTLLYQPEYAGRGNFSLEAEIFLFAGTSQEEYGIFVGGSGLESQASTAAYVAFVARRDGQIAVLARTANGVEPLVAWRRDDAALPQAGPDNVKNVLRVEAGPKDVVFSVNGKPVATLPRTSVKVDGQFGFRAGRDLNLHISRLDFTQKLAPAR